MSNRINSCGLHCIKINHLTVVLDGEYIVEDVNLHLHCKRLNVIIGPNGAGKTTLIKAILGEIPHTGDIDFQLLKDGGSAVKQELKIGYVPQNLNIDKATPSSVYDLIAGFQSRRPLFLPKKKALHEKIKEQLAVFGCANLIDQQVGKLSGGELQRVLLTLATMDEPNLLILDEPVSGIDQKGIRQFYEVVDALKLERDVAIILVSHDLDYVAEFADQVVLMDRSVLKSGDVQTVYESEEFHQVFGQVPYDPANVKGTKEELECSRSI